MGKEAREKSLEELRELIQSREGEFVIHVELGKGEDDEREEPA